MAPTLAISNITLSTTNNSIPTPFFGLEDAMDTEYDFPGKSFKNPSLFPDACKQPNGERNCTTACLDPKQMFASLDTLHNCFVWPTIYVAFEHGGLEPSTAGLAISLGLEKGSARSSIPSSISTDLQKCLLDSCDSNDECGANANKSFPSGGFRQRFSADLTGNQSYGSDDLPDYFIPCRHINAPASADVAGIGVFISYAMQMGLALITFVLAMPWKKMTRGTHTHVMKTWHKLKLKLKKKSPGKPVNPALPSPDLKHSSKRNVRRMMKFDPASAIVPAVVEFHKAQCYFMLATNIASLIVQDEGGLAPESFQQLYNTYIFVKVIAIGGYLPIVFGLLTLRMLNKVGWYLLTLSMASVGVAIGNLYTEKFFTPSPKDLTHLQSQSVQGGPASCGGNNPIAWCYDRIGVNYYGFRATNSGDGANDILVICLVTLFLLIVEHFWNSPDLTNRKIRDFIFQPLQQRSETERSRRIHDVARWSWKFVVPALFTILIIMFLYCFAVFADDLDWFRVNLIYDSSWGFGQIVAILVWAPAIIEYFWSSFRGIEDGYDHRLPDGYHVRKNEVNENNDPGTTNDWKNQQKAA